MGLFDMFKGDKGANMTPHLAFACALLYMMASDGEMDNEEVGHLLSVLGGSKDGNTIGVGANNKELLDNALKYIRKNSLDTFLQEATPLLSDAQKICILVNLVDSSLADGTPEREEQEMFAKFMKAFAISEDRFAPFFEVIALKNDRSVFINQNDPRNSDDYKVTLPN
ncbi:MAG: TerB family tellurite resistance protein [Campylobacterales bacterium]|nr:TerB family tellurite resistance protein [Campylobacterales bacterium]